MLTDFLPGIMRILRADGATAGTGFLVSADGLILTCSHVVQNEEAQRRGDPRPERVTVVFHPNGQSAEADLLAEFWRGCAAEDVAVLRLRGPLPPEAWPLPLSRSAGSANHPFRSFGFPNPSPDEGLRGKGEILGGITVRGVKVLQLRSPEVTPGFSGAPVWNDTLNMVVGMVCAIATPDKYGKLGETAFAVASEVLLGIAPTLDACHYSRDVRASLKMGSDSTSVELVRQFVDWTVKANEKFTVAGLSVALPIEKAWIKLRAMSSSARTSVPAPLAEQIHNYHEWHRLADSTAAHDKFDAETIVHSSHQIVIIGGPGSGKSTLLHRLAHSLAGKQFLVLRVSLRAIALRIARGESFDEALLAVASDGFSSPTGHLPDIVANASYLLADGLDETEPNRANIAMKLNQWVLSHPNCSIVVTTRPVGHNPAWLPEWDHYELLPLGKDDVRQYAETIFELLFSGNPAGASDAVTTFLSDLERSRSATVAARNPQLLGFLLTLSLSGDEIGGSRFGLFASMVEEIRKQSRTDRLFAHQLEPPVVQQAIEILGWLLLNQPNRMIEELTQELGKQLGQDLSITLLQGKEIASKVVSYWEERGLLERLNAGAATTLTFVHMAFQEFEAARYLAGTSDDALRNWIQANYLRPEFNETLLLLGGTDRVELVIQALLDLDDPSDPVSTAALIAADVLGESEKPPSNLREIIREALSSRLTSVVPMVVYDAGDKLMALARVDPDSVGPLALQLARFDQQWTQEVTCCLGLLAGDKYVDYDVLQVVYPSISDEFIRPSHRTHLFYWDSAILRTLLLRGAEYLLRRDASRHVGTIKERCLAGKDSMYLTEALLNLIAPHLTPEERTTVWTKWNVLDAITPLYENEQQLAQVIRASDLAFLDAIIAGAQRSDGNKHGQAAAPEMATLRKLWGVLNIGEAPISDYFTLRRRSHQEALAEVLCGAILAGSIDQVQILADATLASSKLSAPAAEDRLYSLIGVYERPEPPPKPQWVAAKEFRYRSELLLRALEHPASFVSRFAAMLLMECVEPSIVSEGVRKVLTDGTGYTLAIIAQVASDIWGDQASAEMLNRLENKLTPDCAPLIRALGELRVGPRRARVIPVLTAALRARDAELVKNALITIDKLGLDDKILRDTIQTAYSWWVDEGPQDPVGSGVVPENAAAPLLTYLAQRRLIGYADLAQASRAGRSDVRSAAVVGLCRLLAEDETLVEPTFSDLAQGDLPVHIVGVLSSDYPELCRRHLHQFLGLLETADLQVKVACIRAIDASWADVAEMSSALRALINHVDPQIRNEAVLALQALERGKNRNV